ncbi:MAG: adenylosuccinate lyase [Omnitrophica WOR_2 bacterium GWF2_38_59]|nr:MAG: adenylosuccinate lyase [Omnitrophica WOR_2 bacterium GWF2_38_59]OGX47218.1 MAG: adenylosuccinate lyase [Omnitrophica WOR_2 bacterium RIFOXYA2_FULL_38_17]OGX50679.1 MAG: adenylosuccinate lyase [Omnitrophica WOR_2 bacterium RIFOXYA12_FULL_38_10]OGX58950.1 MAG: adenylosuccinate lyase [Omnitrophica WOR_2 bacterium RIFOXYC2_FULL_38_12]OGX59335.1 MAG: adenylosuccinate lyase [Omnitrophica WOR_2 bacterium RIFOXYB2_FULL_38_16]HBG62336.1 adenylosuccinate lyase [Candidatus Omnitrophota bacterium]
MIERYTMSKMGDVWSEKRKMEIMLQIEVFTCEAMCKLGHIPKKSLEKIKKNAKFDIEEVKRLEEKTKHDIVAFINNVGSYIGPEARYLHMGLTSSDLLDTALSVQLVEAADIIIADVKKLLTALKQRAKKHKDTPCIARTHGVHAEPTTFGLKVAVWYDEMRRNLERMEQAREMIRFGKLSGAVGTYANIDPYVEEYVCEKLDLKPANIATQIIQRDHHCQFVTTLALVGCTLNKIATEIRLLQKTEVLEVEEPFFKGQIGSSAMPHKRNPITCERISGMSRLLRANAQAAFENISLWHERDISHSSVERVILPDSAIALDYMLQKLTPIIDGLLVYPKNMIASLTKTNGLIYSQRVLLELMKKGLTREAAYEIIQRCAMQVWNETSSFKDILCRDRKVRKYLKAGEIDACFDIKHYTRHVDMIFKRVGLK